MAATRARENKTKTKRKNVRTLEASVNGSCQALLKLKREYAQTTSTVDQEYMISSFYIPEKSNIPRLLVYHPLNLIISLSDRV